MEADVRETVAGSGDTVNKPGGLPARRLAEELRVEEGPLTDYQIGMIGGALLGLAAGLVAGTLLTLNCGRPE